ncbi:MAG: hypothetical protein AB1679_06310 [Actinomycetota bacterium]|jgi:hypothetical protein
MRKRAGILLCGPVMLLTFIGHNAASSSHSGGDSTWTTYQALSLLHDQTLTLERWQDRIAKNPVHTGTNEHGQPVYTFPWGTAVVIAPVMAGLEIKEKLRGRSLQAEIRPQDAPHETENTVASILVALTTGLMFLIALSQLGSPWWSAGVALSFAFATSAFSTATRALWSHGPAILVITCELAILLRSRPPPRGPGRDRLIPLLGPLFVLAYAVRPTTAVIAVVFTVVVAISHRRRLPLMLAGGALGAAAYFAVNLATYQQLQPAYYSPGRLFDSDHFFEALAGNLISPQRGLLVWCPIVLVAVAGVVVAHRRGAFDALTGGLVAAVMGYWIVISTLEPWWAGFSVGPRLFTDVLPILTVLSVPAVDELRRRHWMGRGAVAAVLAWSLFTNHRGATRFETQLWNRYPVDVHQDPGRIWDWDDPQFLR